MEESWYPLAFELAKLYLQIRRDGGVNELQFVRAFHAAPPAMRERIKEDVRLIAASRRMLSPDGRGPEWDAAQGL